MNDSAQRLLLDGAYDVVENGGRNCYLYAGSLITDLETHFFSPSLST
jgi:hypothetical protein